MKKVLEICVDSHDSAKAAVAGGADRLELCAALSVGGLTPYVVLLSDIRSFSDIPVRCLMRPRAGDFLYTRQEISMMARQMQVLRENGASGFVIGCLTPEGELAPMEELMEAAGGLPLTLHRCIDVSRDPEKTYCQAGELGFDTVLTSGAAANATAGKETIARLIALREEMGGPEVLIGAGVNARVIEAFRRQVPGARAFHMSGKTAVESGMLFRREGVPMGAPGLDEWHIDTTSQQAVEEAAQALRKPLV